MHFKIEVPIFSVSVFFNCVDELTLLCLSVQNIETIVVGSLGRVVFAILMLSLLKKQNKILGKHLGNE